MTLNEFGHLRPVLVHVPPAVLLHDRVESVESGVIVRRIGADELALEINLQEVDGGRRDIFHPYAIGVVRIEHRVCIQRDPRAVLVPHGHADSVKFIRLEMQQPSTRIPADKVLNGLKNYHIGFDFVGAHLLFDLGIENIAETALQRHCNSRESLLKRPNGTLIASARPRCPHDQSLFLLRKLVELIEAIRVARRAMEARDEKEASPASSESHLWS